MQRGPDARNRGLQLSWNWIVHRDIWPANIFLGTLNRTHFSEVVLGDFGSYATRDDALFSRILGLRQQPDFAPPLAKRFTLNPKIDIYQFGLVIVAMCQLRLLPALHHHRLGPHQLEADI
jgi:serine/threonine protein kinase